LQISNETGSIVDIDSSQVKINTPLVVTENILMGSSKWGYNIQPSGVFYLMAAGGTNLTNTTAETQIQGGLTNFGGINIPSLRLGNVISITMQGLIDAPAGSDIHLRFKIGGVLIGESISGDDISNAFTGRYWGCKVDIIPYAENAFSGVVYPQTDGLLTYNNEQASPSNHSRCTNLTVEMKQLVCKISM
jgi:hypothetical protein